MALFTPMALFNFLNPNFNFLIYLEYIQQEPLINKLLKISNLINKNLFTRAHHQYINPRVANHIVTNIESI